MRPRPRIGITAYRAVNSLADMKVGTAMVPYSYLHAVRETGGMPFPLPPGGDDDEAEAMVDMIDGLLMPGGTDINPRRYTNEKTHDETQPPDNVRDAWEMNVLVHALKNGIPVLGVCRGMQVLNVWLKGTLHQHLAHAGLHGSKTPGFGSHPVTFAPGSRLAGILETRRRGEAVEVPTRHHQGVDKLGRGLRASAWHRDGTVEAVEMPGKPFVVGVQWHPERGTDPRLFEAFVKAASSG